MHYLGAVTSQSHTVYFIRLWCCLFSCAALGSHYSEMIRTYTTAGNMYKFVS